MKPGRLFPLVLMMIGACGTSLFAAKSPTYLRQPDAWFKTEEGRKIIDNILTWQGKGPGGIQAWPKAYDASIPRPEKDAESSWKGIATIDNGSTYSEMRLLARAITLEEPGERRDKLKAALGKAIDAVCTAQYENGGWPQRWPVTAPNQEDYDGRITFNDDAIINLILELQMIAAKTAPYAFVDEIQQKKAKTAVDKGIDCILKCQVVVDGKLAGWCAQHDEKTLKPAKGRAYELPSLSGSEGAAITVFLMHLENPNERVKKAVMAAAAWFDTVKIPNKRFKSVRDAKRVEIDRILADAPGVTSWARFYEIETNKPIFVGRDSVVKYALPDLEFERRTGYQWYGIWGQKVLDEYPAWKKRNGIEEAATTTGQ